MGGARKWTLSTALVLTMLLVLSIAATAADEPTIDLISATDAKPGGITTVDFDLNGWDDDTVLTITVDVFSLVGRLAAAVSWARSALPMLPLASSHRRVIQPAPDGDWARCGAREQGVP